MDIIPGYWDGAQFIEEEHYDILQLTMVHCRFIEEEQTVDIQLTVVNASPANPAQPPDPQILLQERKKCCAI